MSPEQRDFLNLLNMPGRFSVQQAAWYLGFPIWEIPVLTRSKLLIPVGRPALTATKLYAYTRLRRLRDDERWMNKASSIVYRHLQLKNRKATIKRKRKS
jgi:hypothetical protein